MKIRSWITASLTAISSAAIGQPTVAQPTTPHPRLIVLTDIEADPDDTQSLIRLLLYANEIDLEGLVATTSVHQKARLAPESIRRLIGEYEKVRPNLVRHDPGFPTADTLSRMIDTGQPGYGMAAIGPGKDTPGSRRIIAALDRRDDRPLWVAGWGGPNTLAQALLTLRATRSPAELKRLVAKLRLYTVSDQDDSGPWIRREFPDLFYIVSPGGYGAATWSGINTVVDGIDNSTISNPWLAANIQQGRGPLGAAYPDVAYGMEGDTPTFLGLIPNGLNMPDRPDWGGWGGRYTLRMPARAELDPTGFNGGVPVPAETRPIWTNAIDTVTPVVVNAYGRATKPMERSYRGFRETLWRWRDDFQNDFAARMQWTYRTPGDVNHPPVVVLPHSDRLAVRSGATVQLSALGTRDQDGDSLSYRWFQYREAGTCGDIALSSTENLYERSFRAPPVTRTCDAHFVLAVTDRGTPPLTRYRRVIVTVGP
ncbi:nucleoside hydrolase-like domain-containing protein [Sphingomonas arantia]|uniref:Nucleoside hydrolase-like domain-containing protein n=1 Tax=Sphingomonas arantia TaxID=1460676 RepID=A0ABW4TYG6_9SPHN